MKKDLTTASLFAESLRHTLKQTDGLTPHAALSMASRLRARDVAWRGGSASLFRPRDASAQRRLLLAAS